MQFTEMPPDVIRSIQHRWLHKCWSELCRDQRLPSWHQFQPEDLTRSLDSVMIFDVVRADSAPRFRLHFQGARIKEIYGNDYTGQFIDQTLPDNIRTPVLAIYDHTVRVAKPVYTICEIPDADDRIVQHERLLLPFADESNTVSRLLTAIEALSPDGTFLQRGLLAAPPAMHYKLCATLAPHRPAPSAPV